MRGAHTEVVVGVLGGMGPAATADFYAKLVRATPAATDQEHLRALIWSDPSIPDRTEALLTGGPDPLPLLTEGASRLRDAGADFLVVPCNTAHAFLVPVRERLPLPLLSMIDETAVSVTAADQPRSRVGVLGTNATRRSGLYRRALCERGAEVVEPDEAQQERVSRGIARVKAGQTDEETWALIAGVATELAERGAEAIIAGCTELPLALALREAPVPIIDPTQVLAEAAVRYATTVAASRVRSRCA